MLVVSGWRLGLDDDEEIQLTALLGKPLLEGASAPWNLYDFGHVRDDPETEVKQKAALVYRGDVKWCQNPLPFRVFFFRPLSSVFLWLEFQAFGLHLRPYHLLRILLFVAACLLAAAVFNRVLAASGATPLPVPLVAALLAANPLNQELLARICTVHYLLAAILGFGAYLILLTSEIRPLLRGGLVVALGAASLLAGEAAFQVHAIGSCAMVVCARTMRREQRIVWALLLIAVLLYFIWYRQRPFDAAGYGYTGFGDTSQWVSLRKGKMLDAGLDLFAGTFLTRVRRWAGFLAFGGSKALVTSVILSVAFLAVVALHLVRVPRTRKLAAALLAGAAISSLPVAAVAQTQMRVVALPALPLQFLLCVMARDAWRELRAGAQAGSFMAWLREPRGAMASSSPTSASGSPPTSR
jgi:hypothetical protein